MEVKIALLADYANASDNGKLNVMGIFTNIFATGLPLVHPQMYLVVQSSASPAEYRRKFAFTVKLIDEDASNDRTLMHINSEVPQGMNGQPVSMNFILTLVNTVFEKEGSYELSILIDNDLKITIPLEVALISVQR